MERCTYNITVDRKDAGKAVIILNKHWNNHDIGQISFSEQNSNGNYRTTYWFDLVVSEDYEIIKNEFRKVGIELF